MRVKLDENLGHRTVRLFRDAGHDVATVFDQHLAGAADADVFAVCVSEERVLVTLDLDFANPLRFDPLTTAGIAVLRVPTLPGARDLDEAAARLIAHVEWHSISGHLWIVDRSRIRQYKP
ncbi:MAG: DUF5615 family PIN-like protein [Egibacteraceae bacterium]